MPEFVVVFERHGSESDERPKTKTTTASQKAPWFLGALGEIAGDHHHLEGSVGEADLRKPWGSVEEALRRKKVAEASRLAAAVQGGQRAGASSSGGGTPLQETLATSSGGYPGGPEGARTTAAAGAGAGAAGTAGASTLGQQVVEAPTQLKMALVAPAPPARKFPAKKSQEGSFQDPPRPSDVGRSLLVQALEEELPPPRAPPPLTRSPPHVVLERERLETDLDEVLAQLGRTRKEFLDEFADLSEYRDDLQKAFQRALEELELQIPPRLPATLQEAAPGQALDTAVQRGFQAMSGRGVPQSPP